MLRPHRTKGLLAAISREFLVNDDSSLSLVTIFAGSDQIYIRVSSFPSLSPALPNRFV